MNTGNKKYTLRGKIIKSNVKNRKKIFFYLKADDNNIIIVKYKLINK